MPAVRHASVAAGTGLRRLRSLDERVWSLGVPAAVVLLSIAALAQTVGHTVAGVHPFPVVLPAL